MKKIKVNFVIFFAIVLGNVIYSQTIIDKVSNLKAFAKLYGYTRFFYPSNEAAKIDWNKFAVYGVEEIINVRNNTELKEKLIMLFQPIVPEMQIYTPDESPEEISAYSIKDSVDPKVVAWQHYGVSLGDKSNIYRSIRTIKNSLLITETDRKGFGNRAKKFLTGNEIHLERLFELFPKDVEVLTIEISKNLFCRFPLTLYYDDLDAMQFDIEFKVKELYEKLNSIDSTSLSADKESVRLADVIIVWNVIQHFYPYFEYEKVDWEKVLNVSIIDAVQNKTSEEFYYLLRKMISNLQDGHGYVTYDKAKTAYGLPIRVNYIENKIVVTASEIESVKKGEIIVTLNGKDAIEILKEKEQIVSGAPQFKRYRALLEFDSTADTENVKIGLLRDEEVFEIQVKPSFKPYNFFISRLGEFNYKPLMQIGDGIYYVNLLAVDEDQFYDSLSTLANSKAVIFDYRWSCMLKQNNRRLSTIKMLMHLIDSTVQSPNWNVPAIVYPDHTNNTFIKSYWQLQPITPFIKCKKIFLVDANVISHMETFLSIVDNYNIGEIIGQQTAGCNGNVNFIPLIGGYEVMFTGMKVLKHDGSQHHLIGIQPTHPVQRTIKAVKEGRDEYLEKAIEVIRKSIK